MKFVGHLYEIRAVGITRGKRSVYPTVYYYRVVSNSMKNAMTIALKHFNDEDAGVQYEGTDRQYEVLPFTESSIIACAILGDVNEVGETGETASSVCELDLQ